MLGRGRKVVDRVREDSGRRDEKDKKNMEGNDKRRRQRAGEREEGDVSGRE